MLELTIHRCATLDPDSVLFIFICESIHQIGTYYSSHTKLLHKGNNKTARMHTYKYYVASNQTKHVREPRSYHIPRTTTTNSKSRNIIRFMFAKESIFAINEIPVFLDPWIRYLPTIQPAFLLVCFCCIFMFFLCIILSGKQK